MRCRSDDEAAISLRVGIVDYLNSWPLAWAFLEGRVEADFEVLFLPPASVAEALAEARIDVGLIPSIEVQRIPGVKVLPGLCVAAMREVRSVLLLSRRPFDRIRRLALDENSRTSAALVRILLAERYQIEPDCLSASPDLETMLSRADAALVIGDPALRVERPDLQVLDLAAEWHRLTGFPFVFAVWAVRDGVEIGDRQDLFHLSLESGMASLEGMIERAVSSLGLERQAVREYLVECLSYTLGEQESRGLELFFAKALQHGLLSELRPVSFVRRTACGL